MVGTGRRMAIPLHFKKWSILAIHFMKYFNENPFRLPEIHECYICPECEGLYFLCGDDQGKYPTILEVFSGLTLESEREEDYDLCRGCAAEKIREKLSDKTINRLKEQERNVQRLLEQLPQDLFDWPL